MSSEEEDTTESYPGPSDEEREVGEISESETTETEGSSISTEETSVATTEEASEITSETSKSPVGGGAVPQDILALGSRQIRAEDDEWGKPTVPELRDLIIQASQYVTANELPNLMRNATDEQKAKIQRYLPLDIPLEVTVRVLDDGVYWSRMFPDNVPTWKLFRYSYNWKSLFIHTTAHSMIENFDPGVSDTSELTNRLSVLSPFIFRLRIRQLQKATTVSKLEGLIDRDFEDILDDAVRSAKHMYLDFEKLFECLNSLTELEMSLKPSCMNAETFHFGLTDFNCFSRGLLKLKKLEKLCLTNSSLSSEQTNTIVNQLNTFQALKYLELSYNFMGSDCCKYIGHLLKSECPLETLIVKYNRIGDEGTKYIAATLASNFRLKKLDLSLNKIGDEGGRFLARALMENGALENLDLSKNRLGHTSGVKFAEVLERSEVIRVFHIQENRLGKQVGRLFSEAISKNSNLRDVKVNFCSFSCEDEDIIYRHMLKNNRASPTANNVSQ